MPRKMRGERPNYVEDDLSKFSPSFSQPQQQQQLFYDQQKQEETIDYRRLTSFLDYDDTFLYPGMNVVQTSSLLSSSSCLEHEEGQQPRSMKLQPGSFFSYDVSFLISLSFFTVKFYIACVRSFG